MPKFQVVKSVKSSKSANGWRRCKPETVEADGEDRIVELYAGRDSREYGVAWTLEVTPIEPDSGAQPKSPEAEDSASAIGVGQVIRIDLTSPIGRPDPEKAVEATVLEVIRYGSLAERLTRESSNPLSGPSHQLLVSTPKGERIVSKFRLVS